jgi:hypothetical protein
MTQVQRKVRGAIEGMGYDIKLVGGKAVVTSTSGSVYEVPYQPATTCTCPDYVHRCAGTNQTCKHITAVPIHRAKVHSEAKRFEEIFG